jgi:glycosyltransferase involved in cell wall biosynthesis
VKNDQRLLIVVNTSDFFLSHRLPIAIAAKKAGYDVHVASAISDSIKEIQSRGLVHHALPITRSGKNPFKEIKTIYEMWRLMRNLRPKIVHLITVKPVVYGGIAARMARVPSVIAAVSGLGTVFMAKGGINRVIRLFVKVLYRISLGHKNIRVIFQNPCDREALLGLGVLNSENTLMIRGSGVALEDYSYQPEALGRPVVVFASRLLIDKGVREFVEAARQLHTRGVKALFWIIGSPDPGNPSTIQDDEVMDWRQEGDVQLLGFRRDIPRLFEKANIVVLPSYYGEGLPKVLIEAAACGRAVVTTDRPGCRHAIEPGRTGLLVPARDPVALSYAIEKLILDTDLRQRMGRAGRELAEREFGIEKVVNAHLKAYHEVCTRGACNHVR